MMLLCTSVSTNPFKKKKIQEVLKEENTKIEVVLDKVVRNWKKENMLS